MDTTVPNVDLPDSRIKVLVVDADAQVVEQLGAALRRRGCVPLLATSYEAARQLWIAERPPMMIADVRLGQFNGLQLLLRARADRADLAAIITSATPDKVLQAETLRFGGRFVVKPVGPDELVAMILAPQQTQIDQAVSYPSVERRRGERRQVRTPGFAPERRMAERRVRKAFEGSNRASNNNAQDLPQ